MFIARAMCGLTPVTATALCSSCSLQKFYLERWPEALNEARRSVLMLMKGSKIQRVEINTVHLYQHYSLYQCTINSSTPDVGIIACAACPTPRLNWSSSYVPPGTTSTIPTGTAQDTTWNITCRLWKSKLGITGRKQVHSNLQS